MAKATVKQAGSGLSKNAGEKKLSLPSLASLHAGGKTRPTFQQARMDKMMTNKPGKF